LSVQDSRLLSHPSTYPDFVESKISQLVSRWGMPRDAVLKEYHREFDASGTQSLRNFPGATPETILQIRQQFAIGRVYQMLVQRPPAKDYRILYLGHHGKRCAKGKSRPYINAFVALRENDKMVIRRMTGNGKFADMPLDMTPLMVYSTTLGRYGETGDLIIDDRTVFRAEQPINQNYLDVARTLSVPIITVAEAYTNPSARGKDNFVIPTDWRCIVGYVSGPPNVFKYKGLPEGIELMGGRMTITDPTVEGQPYVDNQGRTVYPGILGWVPPEFCIYEDGSYCAFFGPIDKGKDAETQQDTVSMNIALVLSIFESGGLQEN